MLSFESEGNQPPAMIRNKRAYMEKDLARCRRHFKVPLAMPSVGVSLLINPLLLLRELHVKAGHIPCDFRRYDENRPLRRWTTKVE